MLDYILEFDRELLLYLNNLGQEPWDGFWFTVTNLSLIHISEPTRPY